MKKYFLSLIHVVSHDQIPKIKTCHMVGSEHPEFIDGIQLLIPTDVLDSEETDEDGSIDNDGAVLDEEDENGSVEMGVITGVTEVVTQEMVEEVQ